MTTPRLGSLPDGSRGFDASMRVGPITARAFYDAGYRFAVRYVRRAPVNPSDITGGELAGILDAGLALMLVQHVTPNLWHPTADMGRMYGQTAALEAARVGYLRGASLWCDLESVHPDTPPAVVIAFCNAWYEAVALAQFRPGLYVGSGTRLTGEQLYRRLKFASYWGAYNLNRDEVPVVRGLQMRQRVAGVDDWVAGFDSQTMDVDVIRADALGGTPTLVLP